jgi:hypothetical protein
LKIFIITSDKEQDLTQHSSTFCPSRVSLQHSPGDSKFAQETEADRNKGEDFWFKPRQQSVSTTLLGDEEPGYGKPSSPDEDVFFREEAILEARRRGHVLAPMLSVAELKAVTKSYVTPPPSFINGMSQSSAWLRMRIANQL